MKEVSDQVSAHFQSQVNRLVCEQVYWKGWWQVTEQVYWQIDGQVHGQVYQQVQRELE